MVAEEQGRRAVEAFAQTLGLQTSTRVQKYDTKLAVRRRFSGRNPESAAKRVARARKVAAAAEQQQRLKQMLYQEMTVRNLGVRPVRAVTQILIDFATRVWSTLGRTQKSRPEVRQEQLALARNWAKEQNVVPDQGLLYVEAKTIELFRKLEGMGGPDKA